MTDTYYAEQLADMLCRDKQEVMTTLSCLKVLGMSDVFQMLVGCVNYNIKLKKMIPMEIQSGGLVIIKGDNIENGGLKIVKNYGKPTDKKELEEPLTEEELMERVSKVRVHIGTTNRLWFPVCKYMMRRRLVPVGDFKTCVSILHKLYPELNLDADDMSSLNVLSFAKEYEEWDPLDSPVRGKTFTKYYTIAELLDI